MRAALIVGLVVVASVAALAQGPAFEVASVRENTSASQASSSSGPAPGRFTVTNVPLRFILLDAFELRDHQLIGAPEWTSDARFDIAATYPAGSVPGRDWRPMLRQLLADRFGLVVHRETRAVPTYELLLARSDGALGRRLVRSNVDCDAWLAEKRPQVGAGGPSPVAPGGRRPECMIMTTRQFITAGTRPIQSLLGPLQALTGRPIVDRTGLTGNFNMDLQWTTSGDLGVSIVNVGGFHDQPHMIREWHALADSTPREWIVSQLPFLQDYEIGGGHD